MITVAVAGGTSPGLGRSILEALNEQKNHIHPIVLGRKSSSAPEWLKKIGIDVRRVNYLSETSLDEALKGVHTVRPNL